MNDNEIIINDEQINKLINCNIDMRIIYYDNISIKTKKEELEHLKRVLDEESKKEKNYKYWIEYLKLSISIIEPEIKLYEYLHSDFIEMLHENNVFMPKELISNIYHYLY